MRASYLRRDWKNWPHFIIGFAGRGAQRRTFTLYYLHRQQYTIK